MPDALQAAADRERAATDSRATVHRTAACRVCGSGDTRAFFRLERVPVQDGRLWPTPEEARRSPVGEIRLERCGACGYVGNGAFDPGKVRFERGYDISLHHSPLYRDFVGRLARRLVEADGLRGRRVLEVGCGNGDFLRALVSEGVAGGVGFDPSLREADAARDAGGRLTLRAERFDAAGPVAEDFVCCRHVLQSLAEPRRFLESLRLALRPGTPVYFELANGDRIFRDVVIWNVIYESCSYFTRDSFARLFELAGFERVRAEPCFSDQYLAVHAVAGGGALPSSDAAARRPPADATIDSFERKTAEKIRTWETRIGDLRRAHRRAIAWGAGARAIAFFQLFSIAGEIPFVVDINPDRQGLYLPITAQRVVPPEFVREYRPELVLVSNPVFEGEIREQLAGLHVDAEVLSLD